MIVKLKLSKADRERMKWLRVELRYHQQFYRVELRGLARRKERIKELAAELRGLKKRGLENEDI